MRRKAERTIFNDLDPIFHPRSVAVIGASGEPGKIGRMFMARFVEAGFVLFATDYPYVMPKESVQMVESSPISDADKEKIYHLNAERWLKL